MNVRRNEMEVMYVVRVSVIHPLTWYVAYADMLVGEREMASWLLLYPVKRRDGKTMELVARAAPGAPDATGNVHRQRY